MKGLRASSRHFPKNWELVAVGEITSDWKGGAPLKPEDFTDDGFPILHKGAIQRGGKISIDEKKKTCTTTEYAQAHPRSVVDRSYMAVTLRDLVPAGPSIGLIANLANCPSSRYLLAQGAYGFHVDKDRVDPSYLVHLSNYELFRGYLKRYCVGSTQIHIRTPVFQAVEIPLPPLLEQRSIAAVLDKADALRDKRRQAITKLDTLLQSVFLDMFGDPVTNPKSWPETTIGNIADYVSSGVTPLGGSSTYLDKGILFIRSQNVLMNDFDLSDAAYLSEEAHHTMKRTWVKNGDVLINITGASIGRVHFYQGEDDSANVNQHVCIIRPNNKDQVTPQFLSYFLSTPSYQARILSQNSGATRQAFNFQQIRSFKIFLPPQKAQLQFAGVCDRLGRASTRMFTSSLKIERLKNSLEQFGFSGNLFKEHAILNVT